LGLFLLPPQWAVMAAIGAVTLRPRRGGSRHRDGAVRALPDRLRHRGPGACSRWPGFDLVGGGSLCPARRTWINVGYGPLSLLVC